MQSDSLMNCVSTLEKLRDVYYSQLDARVREELDDVIAELKRRCDGEQECKLGALSLRSLQIIDHVVSLVTNLTDLMK